MTNYFQDNMSAYYNRVDRLRGAAVSSLFEQEKLGYRFRNSSNAFNALIAETADSNLDFYAPKNSGIRHGNFRWLNGSSNNDLVMVVDHNGNLDCLGDVTGLNTNLSDVRFKENIQDYVDWEESLKALRPVTFTWRSNTPLPLKTCNDDIGFIAQEVASAFPNAHDIKPLGNKMVEIVRYEKLVPLLNPSEVE